MKKLMIAAAAAAMIGGAYADDCKVVAVPQVYDMTITVKATTCKSATKSYSTVCGEKLQYRAQATQKFYGKFWGCDCDVIACPKAVNYGKPKLNNKVDTSTCDDSGIADSSVNNSFMFWGAADAFHKAEMTWSLLQLVGKKYTNIEGVFTLSLYACEGGEAEQDPAFTLTGAGYGTATVYGCADAKNVIKSMSGNVVGMWDVTAGSEISGCKYCGELSDCAPEQFCACVDARDDKTAAFGTFTIKYNASQTKALKSGKWITDANKFKSFVTAEFTCIDSKWGYADGE